MIGIFEGTDVKRWEGEGIIVSYAVVVSNLLLQIYDW